MSAPSHGILNLQREVAEAVSRRVRVKLTPEQEATFNSKRTVEPEAYDAYVQGRYNLSTQFTLAQPLMQAKSYFEEAIRKDPNFALAYSGLTDSYLYLALFRLFLRKPPFQSAHEALRKADQLDDSIGEVHDTLGTIDWRYDWNWEGADKEFSRAIATAPSYPCAHEDRAEFLAFLGRRAESHGRVGKDQRNRSGGPSAAMTKAGVYYQLRDFPRLVEAARKGIASNPNEWVEHFNLGIGYEGTGKLTESISEYQKAVELSNGDDDANASLAHAYAAIGKESPSPKRSCTTSGGQFEKRAASLPYVLATIHAGLGEKDRALQLLRKGLQSRNPSRLSWHLKADPRIDNLRSDSRFQDLVRRVGIPQ